MIEPEARRQEEIPTAKPVAEVDLAKQTAANALLLSQMLRPAPTVAPVAPHRFPYLFNPPCRAFLHLQDRLAPSHRSMKPIGPPPVDEQFLAHRYGYPSGAANFRFR